jgi:hypothetical protein
MPLPSPIPTVRARASCRDAAIPDTPTRGGKYTRPATLAPRYCYQAVDRRFANLPWPHPSGGWQRRRVVTPADPKTAAQMLIRETVYAAKVAWDLWTPQQRSTWNIAAEAHAITGYNLWLSAVLTTP